MQWLVESATSSLEEVDNEMYTALHHAAIGGSMEVTKYLVESNIPVNVRNANDDSAFLLAW